MSIHHLQKILSLSITYGWLGLLYGSLFSLIANDYGYTLHPVVNAFIILSTFAATVAWSFRIEMRMYTPPSKYWTIMAQGLIGMVAGVNAPLLYPIFFLILLAMIEYPCRNCIVFKRMKR